MITIDSEESYTAIVEQFSPMIYRIAYQNLLNSADAEDVVQDVFVKLLRQRDRTFRDEEHIKAWLIRVAVNQCTDFRRKFRKIKVEPLNDYEFGVTDETDGVFDLISVLPEEDRSILYLYYYEGYTIREIAGILGKRQNTVNSRLTRARKKLRDILGDGDIGSLEVQ